MKDEAMTADAPEQPDSRSGAGGIPQQLPMPPYRFQDEGGPSISGGSTFAPTQPQQPDTLTEGLEVVGYLIKHETETEWRLFDKPLSADPFMQSRALTPHAVATRLLAEKDREIEGLVECLAEAMFTADRLRKRVTPDWIGLPAEYKADWRRQALQTKGRT